MFSVEVITKTSLFLLKKTPQFFTLKKIHGDVTTAL